MRKHRLAERLLVDVIGLEWEYVHEEACRWEHVMSDRVERKILGLIGEHRESPYGNPIPGLDELGEPGEDEEFRLGVRSLHEIAGEQSKAVIVRRIGEPAQVDHVALSLLTEAGLLPGRRVQVRLDQGRIIVVPDGGADVDGVSLPPDVAGHVFAADA
jgi:DtxR family Mn-dependent transcriptional regulator